MPYPGKLRKFTIHQFEYMRHKYGGSIPKMAAELNVTPRALHYWIDRNCERTVVYRCRTEDDCAPAPTPEGTR